MKLLVPSTLTINEDFSSQFITGFRVPWKGEHACVMGSLMKEHREEVLPADVCIVGVLSKTEKDGESKLQHVNDTASNGVGKVHLIHHSKGEKYTCLSKTITSVEELSSCTIQGLYQHFTTIKGHLPLYCSTSSISVLSTGSEGPDAVYISTDVPRQSGVFKKQPYHVVSVTFRKEYSDTAAIKSRLSHIIRSLATASAAVNVSEYWPRLPSKCVPVASLQVFSHPIICLNPLDSSYRQQLHTLFDLPQIPTFHWGLRVGVFPPKNDNNLIENIHLSITNHPVGSSTVKGQYWYYHYRCDGDKDDGWGCAYRSLQTILSWCVLNGFECTNIDVVPRIKELQEILFKVDSTKRDVRFVGSCEWIGSSEIFLTIANLYNFECIIHRLESGTAMQSNAETVSMIHNHFIEHGSPIMIGGNQFAFTILGVTSPDDAEVKYLILDPHYSSRSSNLSSILKDGWLKWKRPSTIFKPDSWYNICMPQVPRCV
eukprot:TRINITY_DN2859_c2_g1_i3.p1 TRINITY_DN2859_c2_g1~~TRINITY_DN2859_c2_g1_i3.p1  ORF type:complete len:485 (+),score=55.52 TRINITY_DN2859_c2_g1_i3:166-1620(+)